MFSEAPSNQDEKDTEAKKRRRLSRDNRKKSNHGPNHRSVQRLSKRDSKGDMEEKQESVEHRDPNNFQALNDSLLGILSEIKEDVVKLSCIEDISKQRVTCELEKSAGDNPQTCKNYIQTVRGFQLYNQGNASASRILRTRSYEDKMEMGLAKYISTVMTVFYKSCHGFLGGAALMHLILICTTEPMNWPLWKHASFAELLGITFYFLSTICLVSALDRVYVMCHKMHIRVGIEVAALLIYVVTLLLSLTCDSIDTHLYARTLNKTSDEENIEIRRLFRIWTSISVARCAGGIFGGETVIYLEKKQGNAATQMKIKLW